MADYDIFQIEITKNYGISDWRDDLKKVGLLLFHYFLLFACHIFKQNKNGKVFTYKISSYICILLIWTITIRWSSHLEDNSERLYEKTNLEINLFFNRFFCWGWRCNNIHWQIPIGVTSPNIWISKLWWKTVISEQGIAYQRTATSTRIESKAATTCIVLPMLHLQRQLLSLTVISHFGKFRTDGYNMSVICGDLKLCCPGHSACEMIWNL